MKLALVVAFALAGCVIPAQPSSNVHPTAAAASSAPPAASCQDTLTCDSQCNPMTDACVASCEQRTTPASAQSSRAVLTCMLQSGCRDQSCVAQACGAQIAACTSVAVAAAPTAPATGGGDDVMQPQYDSYGAQIVPAPTRQLTQADLAGEWTGSATSGHTYVTTGGGYGGYDAVSTAEDWKVDPDGTLHENFRGAYTGNSGPSGFQQDRTGTFLIGSNNVITIDRPAQDGTPANRAYYIVVGWFVGTDKVLMRLQGPFYSPITDKELSSERANSIYNEDYTRAR